MSPFMSTVLSPGKNPGTKLYNIPASASGLPVASELNISKNRANGNRLIEVKTMGVYT